MGGWHAMVADFGLARAVSAAAPVDTGAHPLVLGTRAYMSPEQISGSETLDRRSDVYSLGCVLYEMLSGVPPFAGTSPREIAAKHLEQSQPALRTLRPPAATQSLERVDQASGRWMAAILVGIAALATAFVLRHRAEITSTSTPAWHDPAGAAPGDPTHLAVLYFDADGPDSNLRSVANGLTEDLIDQLGEVQALSVISANGVRPYRGHPFRLDSLGAVLGVGTLVTGKVGGTVAHPSITVRLIDPETGRQRDSRTIEPTHDVLSLRGEVARQVSFFLRSSLGEEIQRSRLSLRHAGRRRVGTRLEGAATAG